MGTIVSNITKLRIVYLIIYSGTDPVTGEFPHKWPVTWKVLPFDDVIMYLISDYGFHIPILCVHLISNPCPNFNRI